MGVVSLENLQSLTPNGNSLALSVNFLLNITKSLFTPEKNNVRIQLSQIGKFKSSRMSISWIRKAARLTR